ncbi:MAG: hypothetical protein ACRD5H_13710 [Nitrososphaerales archaeon]
MATRRSLAIGCLVLVFAGLLVMAYGFAMAIACLCVEDQPCPPCIDYTIEAIRITGISFTVGGIAFLGFLVWRGNSSNQRFTRSGASSFYWHRERRSNLEHP